VIIAGNDSLTTQKTTSCSGSFKQSLVFCDLLCGKRRHPNRSCSLRRNRLGCCWSWTFWCSDCASRAVELWKRSSYLS